MSKLATVFSTFIFKWGIFSLFQGPSCRMRGGRIHGRACTISEQIQAGEKAQVELLFSKCMLRLSGKLGQTGSKQESCFLPLSWQTLSVSMGECRVLLRRFIGPLDFYCPFIFLLLVDGVWTNINLAFFPLCCCVCIYLSSCWHRQPYSIHSTDHHIPP